MFRARRGLVAAPALLLAGALALAACGGGSTHSAAPASTTTTTDGGPGSRFVAFRDCMSGHGETLPSRPRNGNGNGGPPSSTPGDTRPPGRGGGFLFGGGNFAQRFANPPAGADPVKYRAAYDACKSTLPAAPNLQNNSALAAFRSCLGDHGVTLPADGSAGGLNRNDPKVQAAVTACRPLLPAGFGRGGATTTTTVHA